jgi:hypothetical protein
VKDCVVEVRDGENSVGTTMLKKLFELMKTVMLIWRPRSRSIFTASLNSPDEAGEMLRQAQHDVQG